MVAQIVAPYGVATEVIYQRGAPPVVNDHDATALQSLGGEDFGWYIESVPGAMARLGTRTPGGHTYDLCQGDLRIGEGAVTSAAALFSEVAVAALEAAPQRSPRD